MGTQGEIKINGQSCRFFNDMDRDISHDGFVPPEILEYESPPVIDFVEFETESGKRTMARCASYESRYVLKDKTLRVQWLYYSKPEPIAEIITMEAAEIIDQQTKLYDGFQWGRAILKNRQEIRVAYALYDHTAEEAACVSRWRTAEALRKVRNNRVKHLGNIGRANKGKRNVPTSKIRQTFKEISSSPEWAGKRMPQITATARRLGISARTVERRLKEP